MNNLAIIPARSGSKGVKNKNIRELNGKPLIAYTIEAALNSMQFKEVMVSTDSIEYAEISKKYGAAVPFLRSEETASDSASSWDMVKEVLQNYKKIGKEFDTFCLLQPTSPLRNADHIKEAYDLFYQKASTAVVSMCEAEHSPLWCGHLPDTLELENFLPRNISSQRQAGGTFYRLNGAIYIVDIKHFIKDSFLYKKGSFAYIMEQDKSVDIDTEIDFQLAELLLKNI